MSNMIHQHLSKHRMGKKFDIYMKMCEDNRQMSGTVEQLTATVNKSKPLNAGSYADYEVNMETGSCFPAFPNNELEKFRNRLTA